MCVTRIMNFLGFELEYWPGFLGVSRWWLVCSYDFFGALITTTRLWIVQFVGVFLFCFPLCVPVVTSNLGPCLAPLALPNSSLFFSMALLFDFESLRFRWFDFGFFSTWSPLLPDFVFSTTTYVNCLRVLLFGF